MPPTLPQIKQPDSNQLKAALAGLITDPNRRHRYGTAARDKCLDRFDHQRMVKALERLYIAKIARW